MRSVMQTSIHHPSKGCSALLSMLIIFLTGCGSEDELSVSAALSPTTTGVGVPPLNASSTVINAVGSNMSTPDGTIARTIPAGVTDDALSFKFENSPLTTVFVRLETLTGARFTYVGNEPAPMVSAEVHGQPLVAALAMALPGYDLLVHYDAEESPRRVWVVSREASQRLRISTESSQKQTSVDAESIGNGTASIAAESLVPQLERSLQDPDESNRYRALSAVLEAGATLSYDVLSTIILADTSSAMRLLALAAAEDASLPTGELHNLAALAKQDRDAAVRARADTLLHTSTANEPSTVLDNSPPSGTNWNKH